MVLYFIFFASLVFAQTPQTANNAVTQAIDSAAASHPPLPQARPEAVLTLAATFIGASSVWLC